MSKRMTYITSGDAIRSPHYAVGKEKKQEIIERLGSCEDLLMHIHKIARAAMHDDSIDRDLLLDEIVHTTQEVMYK